MNKKLILGIAISLVLVSGSFFSAQAGCFSWLSPCCQSTCASAPAPALDFNWRPNPNACCCLSWLSPCNWHLTCPCSGS
jgi:hypothetical protein